MVSLPCSLKWPLRVNRVYTKVLYSVGNVSCLFSRCLTFLLSLFTNVVILALSGQVFTPASKSVLLNRGRYATKFINPCFIFFSYCPTFLTLLGSS